MLPVKTTITDSSATLNILTYPNPSTDQFVFTAKVGGLNTNTNLSIIMYDINGRAVKELSGLLQSNSATTLVWNATNVSAGIYYYKAKTGNGDVFTGKLVRL